MKIKKIICMLLAVIMVVGLMPITAEAATSLIISSIDNWEYISKSNPPTLKWNKVTGAAGYTVTVKNDATGVYYTQNEWTTKTSYSLEDLFDEELGSSEYPRLKIWVGAMKSTDISQGLISLDAQDSIIVVVSECPDVSFDSYSSVTSGSVTLTMTISKDYGSSIEDSGFYIGTSSTLSKMTKYSFADYGSYSATTKGTKTMTITGLNPDTKYYVRAYAENGVGEEYTTAKNFTTKEEEGYLSLSTTSVSWGYEVGNETNITVTCSGSYTYKITYNGVDDSAIKAGYDYEWLDVTKSGNTINIKPSRTNYSKNARVAEIVVTSGSLSKTITVTQKACGESSPTLTLKRGSTVVTDGMNLGTFTTGQPVMEAAIVSSNVRKVSAQLRPADAVSTTALDYSTDLDKISLDISDLPAGDYKITVYASNSDTANDYWSQSPFSDGSMEFYFTLVERNSGGGEGGSGESGSVDTSDSRFSKMGDEYLNSEYFSNLKGVVLTGNGAEDIIRVARSQKGYKEDSNGASAYARFYGETGSVSWCAYFVSWCAGRAEIDNSVITLSSGASPGFLCPYGTITLFFEPTAERKAGWNWTKTAKIIENASRSDYEPKIGDLIFFDWDAKQDTFDHVGIVTGISGNYISYIDGNNSAGTVAEHTNKYLKTNTMITAYARPNYSGSSNPVVQTYTVTYDANGGSGAPAAQTKTEGKALTLSSTVPARSGYTFLGWATSKTATTAQYQPGGSYTKDADVTLYAVWKAEEHKHSFDETVTDPTCTERGYTTYTCSECGYSYVDNYVNATGHDYGGWYDVQYPTCTEKGKQRRDCNYCSHYETRDVAVTGHNYSSEIYEPTCTEKGYTTYTCTECSYSYKDNYVNETGHNLDDWYFVKSPTCTEKGKEQRDCNNCSYNETRDVEATGHNFGEWYETKAPTVKENGEERRDCKNCSHYETREIPKLASYTVTYNANGGSGAPASQTKTEGKALILSSTVPTRSGYTFLGWATSSTATTAQYQPGDSYTKDADITLYAVWKKNEPQKTADIVIGEVSGRPGEIVEVPVYIQNNPGFSSIDLKMEFDSKILELTEIRFEIFPSSNMASLVSGKISGGDSKNITEDGTMFTAVFKIKETAKEGMSNINIVVYECCDTNENFINVNIFSGKIEVCSYVLGDANSDGKVTSRDVTRILQYLVEELGDKTIDLKAADYNCDGKITSRDVTAILKYLVD